MIFGNFQELSLFFVNFGYLEYDCARLGQGANKQVANHHPGRWGLCWTVDGESSYKILIIYIYKYLDIFVYYECPVGLKIEEHLSFLGNIPRQKQRTHRNRLPNDDRVVVRIND